MKWVVTGLVAGLFTMMAVQALAETTTWKASTAGYWTNAVNWSAGVPGPADDVFFTNGTSIVTIDQDVTVNSLCLTGTYSGKITFLQGVAANLAVGTTLYIRNGASIETPFASTNGYGMGRVITVGGHATIDGRINADSCGFYSYGDGTTLYHGPGYDGDNKWGAAHGGRSGNGTAAPYGSLTQPIALGSGAYGTRGGGAIKLTVDGTLTVNGRISADSVAGFHTGAGGSVWLVCDTLAGTGAISATSASAGSSNGQGGGGGRIAIEATARTFTGSVRAPGGTASTGIPGQLGTLWEPNRFPATGDILINGDSYQYHFPPAIANPVWGLSVTNGALVQFPSFTNGVLTLTHLVVAAGSELRFDVDSARQPLQRGLNNLAFSNTPVSVLGASTLGLPSQNYTSSTFIVSMGSTVLFSLCDTNAINVNSGGIAGNPHGEGTTIVCADAVIDGTLQASRTGFRTSKGPGKATKNWDGGSYGGLGGGQVSAPTASCYGSLTRPTALGSGGSDTGSQLFAGGAITLVATNTLILNGAVRADGGSGGNTGTSGGSVWLVAGAFSGNGVVSAVGGPGNLSGSHAAGGGGRIAVDYASSLFSGTMTVAAGAALSSAYPAKAGTLFQCRSLYPGACSLGYDGIELDSLYSIRNSDVKITRQVATWVQQDPLVVWTDTSTSFADNAVTNIATYTLRGLPIDKGIEILTNGVSMVVTNTSPTGTLAFDVVLNAPLTLTVAPGGAPAVATLSPTHVTSTSAYLNGWLSSTGWYDTASMVFWGPTDGIDDANAWSNVCLFPAPQGVGGLSTNVSLPATGEYFYRYAASNAAAFAWASESEYLVSGVTVAAVPSVIGERDEAASFWVSRGPTATSRSVTISFSVGGTAASLDDYTYSPLSSITLATGISSGAVQVVSIPDTLIESDESVILTLTADTFDFYAVGAPGAATLTITNSPPLQVTWTSPTSGDWSNGANWSGGLPPTAGDDVFFSSGAATVTIDADVTVNSLSIAGTYSGTLTFKTGTAANLTVNNDLTIGSSAKIVPTYSSLSGNGTGRTITVLGDARIDGIIDGSGCGFPLSQGPGFVQWSAAHGGKSTGVLLPYGSLTQPTSLGSGNYDGKGGGAIKLKVGGTLTVDGTISADAANATYGAAGGSIWLDCDTLAGHGSIHANSVGGKTYAGAGGRIALAYNTKTYTGSVNAKPTGVAHPGTLWDPGLFAHFAPTVTLDNVQYQYFAPGGAEDYTWGLTLTNGAQVFFHDFTNGVLNVTDLVVAAGSTLRFDVNSSGQTQKNGVNNLAFSNTPVNVIGSSILGLPALTYTCTTFTVAAGSTVYLSGDTGATNAASGGTAGNPHGEGTVFVCTDAMIDGTLQASYMGFRSTTGPGKATKSWDGGSYGGTGGGQATAPTAPCYGSFTQPTALGSGCCYNTGGYGGGAIKIVATRALKIDGTVMAVGEGAGYGGASGGSIWLVAGALSGSGTINVAGGNGAPAGSHGAGGGGRVALEYVSSTYAGSVNVAGGAAASSAYPAKPGTLFQCEAPVVGACAAGVAGQMLTTSLAASHSDVKLGRSMATWKPSRPQIVWTDTPTQLDDTPMANVATYDVSGLRPDMKLFVTIDDVLALTTNASPTGEITFDVTLDGPRTIAVQGLASGSVIILQ